MDPLQTFVEQAHAKGWDDQRIRTSLAANGWSEGQITNALGDLAVPMAPAAAVAPMPTGNQTTHSGRPSITALQAALQHVLLWLFTLTSSIMVNVVSFALFAAGEGSSEALLTFVVLELVTFTPFALLYFRYLRRLKREPELMTGRIWSIITIVLHTIGLLSSVVGFILVIILVHNGYTVAGLVSGGVLGAMNGLVVAAYTMANFAKSPHGSFRRRFLWLFPILLFVLIAALGVVALLRVAPLKADDQTRQNLVTTVTKVHDYASNNKKLPTSLTVLSDVPTGVSYQQTSSDSYKVCATLKQKHAGFGEDSSYTQGDDYVSTGSFYSKSAGNHCWKFTNYDLQNQPVTDPIDYSDPSQSSDYRIN